MLGSAGGLPEAAYCTLQLRSWQATAPRRTAYVCRTTTQMNQQLSGSLITLEGEVFGGNATALKDIRSVLVELADAELDTYAQSRFLGLARAAIAPR